MKDSEYKSCIDGLGLLEGEEKKLQYVSFREIISTGWNGKARKKSKKGLLVFTNDNMIFMQQEGAWSSNYTQALRIPLEQIAGISYGGRVMKHISVLVGKAGASQTYAFNPWKGCKENSNQVSDAKLVTQEIQNHLNHVRQEKKRLAQEALAKGTVPAMIFCKYCGARNKADQTRCVNCGATLT